MRKLLTALLLAFLALSAAFAAGEKEAAAPAKSGEITGKIVFLTNRTDRDTDGTFERLIALFNENIHVWKSKYSPPLTMPLKWLPACRPRNTAMSS